MTTRDLPPEEWHRLLNHPSLDGNPLPDPGTSRAVVIENDEGEILAVWFAIMVVHLEPVWIHPSYRGSLGLRLWNGMKRLLDSCSIKSAFCFSETPDVSSYLTRLGAKLLPYQTHLLEV